MGYSARILWARPLVDGDVEWYLARHGFPPQTTREDGWIESELPGNEMTPEGPDVARLLQDLGGPLLIADITHSDFAFVVAVAPGEESVTVVLTPDAYRRDGAWMPDDDTAGAEQEAFAAWSRRHTPLAIDPDRLRELAADDDTIADDRVWRLVDLLGIAPLPDPEPVEAHVSDA